MKIIIIICIAAIIIFVFAIIAFLLNQRHHKNQIKHKNKDGAPISEEGGQVYEDAGYEQMDQIISSGMNVPPPQQYTGLQRQQSTSSTAYLDLLQEPDTNGEYKSIEIQHLNTSTTYQDLIPTSAMGGQSSSNSETIYSSIEMPTNTSLEVPGTSFNLFRRSMENFDQDPSDINKDNFSSYVKVDCENLNSKTNICIYKKPSSVPKFQPPLEDMVRPDMYKNSGSYGVTEPVYESV